MPREKFTLRWGILGWIASEFSKDILLKPSSRGVCDVVHQITAVGSSSSVQKAQDFIHSLKIPNATAYGNYDDLVKDPKVDVIYVATPHSHHYDNVKSALNAGKHVLCEKPFTVNAQQAKILVKLAREKRLFLLEAIWTRFFPLSSLIRDTISTGAIGIIHFVFADTSFMIDKGDKGLQHRAYNPDLAGGSLLDLGIYSVTWVMQAIYDAQKKRSEKPTVTGSLVPVRETGVDEAATVVLTWKDATGIATSGIASPTDGNHLGSAGPAVKIVGTKGTITIPSPTFRPTEFTIHLHSEGRKPDRHVLDIPGKGMHWQADATARAIRDGKSESDILPLDETILIMEIMDKVRQLGGLKYPESIEKV